MPSQEDICRLPTTRIPLSIFRHKTNENLYVSAGPSSLSDVQTNQPAETWFVFTVRNVLKHRTASALLSHVRPHKHYTADAAESIKVSTHIFRELEANPLSIWVMGKLHALLARKV